MALGTTNRDGGKTSESGHLRAIYKALSGEVLNGLAVSQRGAGANMSVDVAIGDAVIPRSDGTYGHPSFNDAIANKVITTADVTNPRRDIVIMYVDYNVTPSTGVSNNTNGVVVLAVVAGTPAGSPVDPSAAALQAAAGSGNPYIKLARVRVGASATSITNSVIDDLRERATGLANGGWSGISGLVIAYASASSFTVTGADATTIFAPGTKVRLYQGGSLKWFTVTKSVFSTDTTVTVDGDGTYTLTNVPLDALHYSYDAEPVGFPNSFRDEYLSNYVVSGIVASGDNYGVNKNYSITAGVVYLNGKRLTVAAVAAQTVGASKDRYVDLRDNGDGTATYITNEVSNNAASQALTAGDMRVAIIVAGATTIAAVGSINQGEVDKVLPIASSVAYSVTDSLGNLICNRSPNPTVIGYRQIVSNFFQGSATGGTDYDVTGLSVPVIVPAGRKVKIKFFASQVDGNVLGTLGDGLFLARVAEGATQLERTVTPMIRATVPITFIPPEAVINPTTGLHTYKATIGNAVTNNITITAGSTRPAYISVELV